jgi:hypothetical protein
MHYFIVILATGGRWREIGLGAQACANTTVRQRLDLRGNA